MNSLNRVTRQLSIGNKARKFIQERSDIQGCSESEVFEDIIRALIDERFDCTDVDKIGFQQNSPKTFVLDASLLISMNKIYEKNKDKFFRKYVNFINAMVMAYAEY